MDTKPSYFSVRYDLIQTNQSIGYDLFVNSSAVEGKDKFIRIFRSGNFLEKMDLEEFHRKYLQLYIPEEQRTVYLKSLVKSDVDDVEKATVIKEAALDYLHQIFDKDKEFSTEILLKKYRKLS